MASATGHYCPVATLTLGETVKNLRTSKGLSQERLAVAAGCSSATIKRLENGATPGLGILRAIARELGVSVSSLLEDAA